jgi:hypothetical protein
MAKVGDIDITHAVETDDGFAIVVRVVDEIHEEDQKLDGDLVGAKKGDIKVATETGKFASRAELEAAAVDTSDPKAIVAYLARDVFVKPKEIERTDLKIKISEKDIQAAESDREKKLKAIADQQAADAAAAEEAAAAAAQEADAAAAEAPDKPKDK